MRRLSKHLFLFVAMLGVSAACLAAGDTTFGVAVTTLTNWLGGSLGIVLALGALMVGLAIGIVQQSVMAVTVGIAVALAASLGPTVIISLFAVAL